MEERLFISPVGERRRASSMRVTSRRELLQEGGWMESHPPSWLPPSGSASPNSSSMMRSLTRSHSLKNDNQGLPG